MLDLLNKIASDRIILLDGGMGALLQKMNLQNSAYACDLLKDVEGNLIGNYDILPTSSPEIIKSIHREYLNAGADIIETCSFNSNRISQADFGAERFVYKLNFNAAKIAKEVCAEFSDELKPHFVAGSIGPTNQSLTYINSPANHSSRKFYFDDFVNAYSEQISGLADGGADLLLIETVYDALNCKAALFAANQYFKKSGKILPIIVSCTIDINGKLLTGQSLESFYYSIADIPNIFAIGLNCSFGAKEMLRHAKALSEISEYPTIFFPNAGLPNEFGEYNDSAVSMAKVIEQMALDGLTNIVGGCCGSTPLHIKEIAEVCKTKKPRILKNEDKGLFLSSTIPFNRKNYSRLIKVGESCNCSGSKSFMESIVNSDYEKAINIACAQIENGGDLLDINLDSNLFDAQTKLREFLNQIMANGKTAKVPIILDSSNWNVLLEGMKYLQGKSIISSLNLKDGEQEFIKKAEIIRDFGHAVIIGAIDENGLAETADRKLEILSKAFNILTEKVCFKPWNIILDPCAQALGSEKNADNSSAREFIKAVELLKSRFPLSPVCGGISNISYLFKNNQTLRTLIEARFLVRAERAGLDFAILNVNRKQNQDLISEDLKCAIDDFLFNRANNLQKIIDLIDVNNSIIKSEKNEIIAENSVVRLAESLINGNKEKALELIKSEQINNSSLDNLKELISSALNLINEKFAHRLLFLPELIKSVDIAKLCFEQIHIDFSQGIQPKAKILLATVKGDIHDIGKNIVGIVLSCNNYQIIDIGIKATAEYIIESAIAENVSAIGLSGLISPSLEEMTNLAKLAEEKKLSIPILIGGAATSKKYTAIKIAPCYSGAVIYAKNAIKALEIAERLFVSKEKENFLQDLSKEYNSIRDEYSIKHSRESLLNLAIAREKKAELDFSQLKKPKFIGIKKFTDYSISELRKYINWKQYYLSWQLRGNNKLLTNSEYELTAKSLYRDANLLLDKIEKNLCATASFGIFHANSNGEDIEIYSDDKRNNILTIINCLRQQNYKETKKYYYSLADFLAPKINNANDYIGAFITSINCEMIDLESLLGRDCLDYWNIALSILCDRLAESFAEKLHLVARQDFFGIEQKNDYTIESLLLDKYRGIRAVIGYPAIPDHTIKKDILNLLDAEKSLGISLTENYMISPKASVCGLIFAHPSAKYFRIDSISREQAEDYCKRKNVSISEFEKMFSGQIVD